MINSLQEKELQLESIDVLMEKYKHLVRIKVNELYLLGGEKDDLIQEGMIGLFKAVQSYNKEKGASFQSFANLCIERQIYTAIEAANRKKNIPLNSYISLYQNADQSEEMEVLLIEKLKSDRKNNPEDIFLDKEYLEDMEKIINTILSGFEKEVLHFRLQGEDYKEIAKRMKKEPKAIDNALQRIKKKIEKAL